MNGETMSEQLYRVMSDDVKQLYCIESVDGEMFSMQEIVDLLNGQQATISALKEENEQLKQEIIVYKKAFQEQVQRCTL